MEKYWFKSNIFAQLSEIVEANSEKKFGIKLEIENLLKLSKKF